MPPWKCLNIYLHSSLQRIHDDFAPCKILENIQDFYSGNERLRGIGFHINNYCILIVNRYLPYSNGSNLDEYLDYFCSKLSLSNKPKYSQCIIMLNLMST